MNFQLKHAQPFSLSEALQLDPSTITTEITRLKNSLGHLRISNTELEAFLKDEGEDVDLRQSVEENKETIASQEERIIMLQVALASKIGVRTDNSHYVMHQSTSSPSASAQIPSATLTRVSPPLAPPGLSNRPPLETSLLPTSTPASTAASSLPSSNEATVEGATDGIIEEGEEDGMYL